MEQIDGDQPLVLTPDPSTPQREARVGPICTCSCNFSPCRAGTEVSGKKHVQETKEKQRGDEELCRASPTRSAWLITHG